MAKSVISYRLSVFSLLLIIALWTVDCGLWTAYGQTTSSAELIEHAKESDGQNVSFEGEVIGEVMVRGEYAWVNLHDGKNAIGIWMTQDLAGEIQYAGTYQAKGDWLEVAGVFHRACPEHGGDLDIHAQTLRKISAGRALTREPSFAKINQVVVLFLILCGLWILTHFKRK